MSYDSKNLQNLEKNPKVTEGHQQHFTKTLRSIGKIDFKFKKKQGGILSNSRVV